MKKSLLVTLFLFLFFLFCFSGVVFGSTALQTEIIYPDIGGGTIPPHTLQKEGIAPPLWSSYFLVYVFRLLFILSFFVIFLVSVYGSILYFSSLSSSSNSVKIKSAKGWLMGAMQGALVISFSVIILSSIGNQFVLFRQINITDVNNQYTPMSLNWSLSNQYFQIPFGSIIEKALLNNHGKKNIYDIFIKTKHAERTAHKIEEVVEEFSEILSVCPSNKECDGVFFITPGPEDPNNRPEKINIFADPINLITAREYLNNDIYNFIDTSRTDFALPINNWQRGDVVLGDPSAPGGISSNDFDAINGPAIRLFGENRLDTEMALRLAIRHNNKDKDYGSLEISALENHKIIAKFNWSDDTLALGQCSGEDQIIPRASAKIVINPIINILSAPGKGFINVFFEDGPILCLQKIETIWTLNESNGWLLRCIQNAQSYIDTLPSFYKNTFEYTHCPQEFVCENNTCTCIEEGPSCTNTNTICLKDVDCRETMHYLKGNGWINYTNLIPPVPENLCPNLTYIISELIVEAEYYDNELLRELEDLHISRGFIENDLYNLLKATILKSLIFESSSDKELLLSYISFDFDRNYHGRGKDVTSVTTYNSSYYDDDYYSRGGSDWSEWVDGINPDIEYIPHHNDPVTFYLKMDLLENPLAGTANNIINSALEIASRLKEGGIQYAGDRAGLDDIFPPPPTDNFAMLFPPVDPEKTRISSSYGWRSSPRVSFHRGIDFARKDYSISSYPIYAVEDGIVRFSGGFGNYGNLIIVEHLASDIEYLEKNIQTYYAHLRTNSLKVVTGDRVERGEHIAFMGTTGFSTGIHLHFEIREMENNSFSWGTQVNPFVPSESYNNQEYLNLDWWVTPGNTSLKLEIKNNFLSNTNYIISSLKGALGKVFNPYALADNDADVEMVRGIALCVDEDVILSEDTLPLTMDLCRTKIEMCLERTNTPQDHFLNYLNENINLWEDVLFSCGININDIFMEDSERLVCGNEIPVGEAFELTWRHLVELLDKINIYIGEGQELLNYVRGISGLVSKCSCLCNCTCYNNSNCFDCCRLNECPVNKSMELTSITCNRDIDCESKLCNIIEEGEVGYCVKEIDCCFKNEIEKNKESITYIRNVMSNILYTQIKTLSHGFYNEENTNVCEKINRDVINYGTTDDEITTCNTSNNKKITMYDLIKRKLYLSRRMLDACKNEDLEAVFQGEITLKKTIFGPLAEMRNLQRNTKSTSVLNVCCCPGEINSEEDYNLCPVGKPNQINTMICTAAERDMGCETVTRNIQKNTSTFNWFCCSSAINN